MTTTAKIKVFVGLSGGVDSSVAAALLKEQGYDVTGVFIRIWREEWGECGWKSDRRDAMAVALALDIPFQTVDLSEEYYDGVARYMITEYQAGRTPNPDVMCNSVIKFGAFLDWAKAHGADYVATGHYARMQRDGDMVRMLKGVDNEKDQTYFLWQLTQKQLRCALFPIGEFEKSQVRELARKFNLPTADKKDSQGLCFIGKVAMKEFLQTYIKPQRGAVLNEAGESIGHHDGAVFLTLGQRHGFTVIKKTPENEPYYIVAKDVAANTITVAHRRNEKVLPPQPDSSIVIHGVHWIAAPPQPKKTYEARFRYRQPLQRCILEEWGQGQLAVRFSMPQEVAAPGQSVVVYDGEACIGGGIIAEEKQRV